MTFGAQRNCIFWGDKYKHLIKVVIRSTVKRFSRGLFSLLWYLIFSFGSRREDISIRFLKCKSCGICWTQTDGAASDIYAKSQTRHTASSVFPSICHRRNLPLCVRRSSPLTWREWEISLLSPVTPVFSQIFPDTTQQLMAFYRRALTTPDVSMHYYPRCSCFMEVLAVLKLLFIIAFPESR